MKDSQGLAGRRVTVIGAGNMGGAVLMGLKPMALASLSFFDIDPEKTAAFSNNSGIAAAPSLAGAIASSDLVVLAIKPQVWPEFARDYGSLFKKGQLVISIMAGIRLRQIASGIPEPVDRVRAMPNTPALVGEGFTAVSGANPEGVAAARAVFSPLGTVVTVEEEMLDRVTAVSGAGPAYVYAFIEHFIAAAREQGFDPETAQRMVLATLKGAVALQEKSGESPAVLRANVTSRGGVTEAALKEMNSLGFEQILSKGIAAGVRRAGELGK